MSMNPSPRTYIAEWERFRQAARYLIMEPAYHGRAHVVMLADHVVLVPPYPGKLGQFVDLATEFGAVGTGELVAKRADITGFLSTELQFLMWSRLPYKSNARKWRELRLFLASEGKQS